MSHSCPLRQDTSERLSEPEAGLWLVTVQTQLKDK